MKIWTVAALCGVLSWLGSSVIWSFKLPSPVRMFFFGLLGAVIGFAGGGKSEKTSMSAMRI